MAPSPTYIPVALGTLIHLLCGQQLGASHASVLTPPTLILGGKTDAYSELQQNLLQWEQTQRNLSVRNVFLYR